VMGEVLYAKKGAKLNNLTTDLYYSRSHPPADQHRIDERQRCRVYALAVGRDICSRQAGNWTSRTTTKAWIWG